MFLTKDVRLDNVRSPISNRKESWSSASTSASSIDNPPSSELLQALIRDLSFWDSLPPDKEHLTLQFPSPLPRRPQSFRSNEGSTLKPRREDDRPRTRSSNGSSERKKGTIKGSHSHINNSWRPQSVWKQAVDPMTGKTYYYDAVTRQTQWEKPDEVRQMERQKKSQRRKRDRLFFREMEKNILKSLSRGEMVPGIPKAKLEPTGPPLEPRNANRNFRTLSRMDDTILAELRDDVVSPAEFDRAMQQARNKHSRSASRGRPPLPGHSRSMERSQARSRSRSRSQQHLDVTFNITSTRENAEPTMVDNARTSRANTSRQSQHRPPTTARGNSSQGRPPSIAEQTATNHAISESLAGERLLDGPIQPDIQSLKEPDDGAYPNKGHIRRNTGGTIYVNGTMSNPDVEATIKCVCGVYRAHLVQASETRNKHSPVSVISTNMDVFNDLYHLPASSRKYYLNTLKTPQEALPSLADIVEFYQEFYRRSQMEFDTIIMSLIYVERLIKTTNVVPGPTNWRSVLFSCMVLASKVWDDLSMWNIDFSNVASANTTNTQAPGLTLFTLQRVNQLELVLLKSLNFDVRVPASEYAKYYFLIRTMLLRSGLLEGAAKPLGKEEAKLLENRTSQYQDSKLGKQRDRRTKSMFELSWISSGNKSGSQPEGEQGGPVLKDTICLEQLVNMSYTEEEHI